jgi:hypothetical protein
VEVKDDTPLQELHGLEEVDKMLDKYFEHVQVEHASFALDHYFPWKSKPFFSKHRVNLDKKPLTIRILIESAKAER